MELGDDFWRIRVGLLKGDVVIDRAPLRWSNLIFTHTILLDFIIGPRLLTHPVSEPFDVCLQLPLGEARVGFSFLWLCLPCGLLWSVEGGGSGGGNPTLRSQGYGWPLPSLFCHRGWAHLTGLLNSESWCKHGGAGAYREQLYVLSLLQSPSNPPNSHV